MNKLTNDSTYKLKLAKTWLRLESFDKTKMVSSSYQEDLEPDGRKRSKAISGLCATGYINMVNGKLQITAKAFNEVKGTKPDFTKIFGSPLREAPSGFALEELPIESQKYIFDNKNDYKLFFESRYSDKTQTPTEFGVPPKDLDKVYNHTLMVVDTAFEEARQKFVDDATFKQVRKRNLVWGLTSLGLLEEGDVDMIKVKDHDTPFNPGGFKQDPDNWCNDLYTELERLQKRIDDSTKQLFVLTNVKSKMDTYGGWDKFLVDYDGLIAERIQKEKHGNESQPN